MRPRGFAGDLEALRSGSLDFNTFARRHVARFRAWAGYFYQRWPQNLLDVDDLAQEGLLEAWRAVDTWDPEIGNPLERYVEYNVGRKMRVELERVLGWPKKSRGTKPPRFCPLSAVDASPVEQGPARGAEGRLLLKEVAEAFEDPLDRDVVAGIGLGMSIKDIASEFWRDEDRRVRYQFADSDDAIRRVRTAVRRASASIS